LNILYWLQSVTDVESKAFCISIYQWIKK